MTKRIYRVALAGNLSEVRLVEAANAAQALHHVAHDRYVVAPVKMKDLAALVQGGVAVEPTGRKSAG